ncbi:Alpha-1,4-glucan:maltose-1-phosphate maltosyltransferase [compost metagenome]
MKRLTETGSADLLNADPLWYKDAVIYQLHIKSFYDANGDGVGDFAGLLAKLDYLVNLGVDTVWLLPFYPSPRRDDGYDIADYRNVHPDYGTLAEARRFVAAAHARGLRVITELVINHTSDQHPWFQRARKAKPGSAARRYYVWSDHDQSYAGTRIIFCDTEKSNWSWDPVAGAYFWHRFYSHQPDLNFDNPQVLNEVLSVMRFWLDMGIDGLRLDAVPYLVEREGTSNENLPETHAVIRHIRAHLDQHFRGRMLLAEANMWPEDAQQYFGLTGPEPEGDECHMAFHFPLMPRMYMAIAREDRFPITDIMRQTPEVPPNCQWAIFLRNHDELTLEMVTSSERDYLWEVYATDRRARINLGIRRRLAPLMERDRRRIELMNSLLFSMPGTPVIYYGDEIGMGDNIHLGDRDGVRTPMQWSPDRNGGFSHADPERLVLPPLQGPLYGYEAVNVEAQARDPHSLLNWMRRMLALRRKHHAFGRGTLRFLFPGNRKILAYLREYEDEHILCVANLSRAPQAVELDLSAFNARVPVEMMGATPFPAIGTLTYLLTLPPYGFYWFVLSDEAQPPSWHVEAPEQMPDQITLVMQSIGRPELTDASRRIMASDVLPHYIGRRRWFGAKHERIERIELAYVLPFARGSSGEDVYLGEVEVVLPGRTERYQLPLGILWDRESADSVSQLAHGLSMARVRQGSRVGLATDGFVVEPFAREVVRALRNDVQMHAGNDIIHFRAEPGLAALELKLELDPIEYMSAEQSNSSLSYNNTAVLKMVRRVSGGIHPEAEMTRYLTAQAYAHAAPLLGEVVRTGPDGVPHTLMLLQGYVLNQGNGWDWTLDYLGRAIDDALPSQESEDEFAEAMNGYSALAGTLGRRLAELHAVLARPTGDDAFAPLPATEGDARAWAEQAMRALQRALTRLESAPATVPGPVRQAFEADVQTLMAARDALPALVEQLAAAAPGSLQTRIHGDFHLGQVLIAQNDTYLVDFEGEPGLPLDWRRRKTSPLRDVAGLLRSLDYAAATVGTDRQERTHSELPPQLAERRAVLLERFRTTASEAFLNCYHQHMQDSGTPWVAPDQLQPLLDLFLLERAAYEVDYEAANRVAWIDLPVSGLARLLRKLLAPGDQP